MGIRFTPGVSFLVHRFPVLLIAVFVVFALEQVCAYFSVTIPTWFLVFASISSLPLYAAGQILLIFATERRDAVALGACSAPVVRGRWPGNIDVLRTMIHNFHHGYPGMEHVIFTYLIDANKFHVENRGWFMGDVRRIWANHQLTYLLGESDFHD
jgi:hypothetical protein